MRVDEGRKGRMESAHEMKMKARTVAGILDLSYEYVYGEEEKKRRKSVKIINGTWAGKKKIPPRRDRHGKILRRIDIL